MLTHKFAYEYLLEFYFKPKPGNNPMSHRLMVVPYEDREHSYIKYINKSFFFLKKVKARRTVNYHIETTQGNK